jgi:hypothetical protein
LSMSMTRTAVLDALRPRGSSLSLTLCSYPVTRS